MKRLTTEDFAARLASAAPVPGGGGASALAGALGIALGSMVGALTVGKKKYADVEAEISDAMRRAETLRERLLQCMQKDAEAFEPLSKAYGIPKDAPGRDETLEKCLQDAARVPLEIFDLCCEAIDLLEIFGTKGSRLMISDAATGAAIAKGAMAGAAVNVRVNTGLMKDRTAAAHLEAQIEGRMEASAAKADRIYQEIWMRLTEKAAG